MKETINSETLKAVEKAKKFPSLLSLYRAIRLINAVRGESDRNQLFLGLTQIYTPSSLSIINEMLNNNSIQGYEVKDEETLEKVIVLYVAMQTLVIESEFKEDREILINAVDIFRDSVEKLFIGDTTPSIENEEDISTKYKP